MDARLPTKLNSFRGKTVFATPWRSVISRFNEFKSRIGCVDMLVGGFDSLQSNGFFYGWAYDDERPKTPLHLIVTDQDGFELAEGIANRYRGDVAAAGFGTGWSGFHLRTEESISRLRESTFNVIENESGAFVFQDQRPPFVEIFEVAQESIAEAVSVDPTSLDSVTQLAGYASDFDDFIRSHGVNAFVRAAYVYILQRPADPDGLTRYGRLLRQGLINPYTMIETLATSSEYSSRPRLLAAPTMPSFPFFSEA